MALIPILTRKKQPKFLGTLWMIGVFIGSLLGGPLSDKLGRALTSKLMICVIGPSIAAIGLTSGYPMFALAHALSLVFNSAIWISSITHIVELSNKNVRENTVLLIMFVEIRKENLQTRRINFGINCAAYSAAPLLVAFVAYFERDWRLLHIWIGVICSVSIPVVIFVQVESPRWLIINGRIEKAKTILTKVRELNHS